MSLPLVTVLLPVFNAADTLPRALQGIRAQTWAGWELVAVDDGSTDASGEILQRFAADDARVRVLRRPHAGIAATLNAGLAAARGKYVARMDADDEMSSERLHLQASFLEEREHAGIGLVGCAVEFGGAGESEGYALHVDWLNSLVTPEEIALNRFIESPLAHPSVMFRRELVEHGGGYRDGDFPEDYELWLRWLDAGVRMAKVRSRLVRWNDPPRRLSRIDPRYRPEAFFQLKAPWVVRAAVAAGNGRAFWIWGAGRPTRRRAAWLEAHGLTIAGYIDVDARKATPAIGGTGRPVRLPDQLPPPSEAFVLGYVSSRGARELIREKLRDAGYHEGRDFLMCA